MSETFQFYYVSIRFFSAVYFCESSTADCVLTQDLIRRAAGKQFNWSKFSFYLQGGDITYCWGPKMHLFTVDFQTKEQTP